jgi:ABC-2 type transport system permease protein
MRILLTLLTKEFKQIFRNKVMIPIIFVVPLVQMILLTYAASLEMKGIKMVVVDQDMSQASRLLVSGFSGSPFFDLVRFTPSYPEAESMLTGDRADVILHIQHNFEKRLYKEQQTDLQLVINAINATEAGLINAYSTQIVQEYNKQVRTKWFGF